MRDGTDQSSVLALGLAVAVLLAVLSLPLLEGRVFVQDDLGNFHLPLRYFYARCLATGDSFVWSPYYYGGFYLHGEGQIGLLHPAHLLMYRLLPFPIAFDLELWVCYPLLFAGMVVFLRRLGFDRASAWFGALVFAFGSFNLLHHVHLNALQIVAHVPWLLVCIDLVLRSDDRRHVAWAKLAIALLTLSQVLLGHPQFVIYCLMIEGAYAVFVTLHSRRLRPLISLAEAKLLGLLAGAVQLLPTWEALKDSERARPGAEFLAEGSLHPANLLQLVGPYAFKARVPSWQTQIGYSTHEYGMYCGALVPVFLLWLWIRRDQLGRWRPLVIACLVFAVAATLLAFGKYLFGTELFAVLMGGIFRFPARNILLVQFAASLLSAVAFGDLLGLARRSQVVDGKALAPLALAPLAALVPIALKLYFEQVSDANLAERFASMRVALSGPALLLAATVCLAAAARGARYAPLVLIFFVAADQGYYGLSYVWHDPPVPLSTMLRHDEGDPPLDSGRLAATHLDRKLFALAMQGAKLVDGYVALVPDRQLAYRVPVRQDAETAGDFEPLVDEEEQAALRLAGAGWLRKGNQWHRLANPVPRAWLVTSARVSDDPQADLLKIDPLAMALVSEPIAGLSGKTPGRVQVVTDRPGNIAVRTETTSRSLLVLNESYHRGWRLKLDGAASSVVRVDGDFLGCVVAPGVHDVRFHFSPSSLYDGAWLSAVGLLLVGVSFASSFLAGRRAAPGMPLSPTGGSVP